MIYYKEEQPFGTVKLWIILMAVSFSIVIGVVAILYTELQPKHDSKLPDELLIIIGVFALLSVAAIDWLLLSGKLQVKIRNKLILYRFPPFIWSWRMIKRENIQSFEIKTYNSNREHKGYGYHNTKLVKALTVSGNTGLQLTLYSGKKLLLGTQKPDKIKKTMEQLMKKETDHG